MESGLKRKEAVKALHKITCQDSGKDGTAVKSI